ncbi:MAG: hypothetical protein LBC25_00370 [Holosporales bacterium]|jgi:hypothetical protein|nr:hypothetical protein [Holosporales bacterium]
MNEDEIKSKKIKIMTRKTWKSLWVYLLLAICVSAGCTLVILKIWTNRYELDIQNATSRCDLLENKIKAISDSVSDTFNKIDDIMMELKSSKESSSYIYTSIASLQKDVECIKNEINIKINHDDDISKTLPPEKKEFIESFENLVKDGAPFAAFIAAHSEKIDMKKYATGNEIMKFSEMTIKSAQSLWKAFASISVAVFDTVVEESFWEKQKRIIKEKILGAFKIWKKEDGDEAARISSDTDDKSLFTMALGAAKDGDFEKSLEILEKIDVKNEELSTLMLDMKKRADLEKTFRRFKTDFIESESKNISISNK